MPWRYLQGPGGQQRSPSSQGQPGCPHWYSQVGVALLSLQMQRSHPTFQKVLGHGGDLRAWLRTASWLLGPVGLEMCWHCPSSPGVSGLSSRSDLHSSPTCHKFQGSGAREAGCPLPSQPLAGLRPPRLCGLRASVYEASWYTELAAPLQRTGLQRWLALFTSTKQAQGESALLGEREHGDPTSGAA